MIDKDKLYITFQLTARHLAYEWVEMIAVTGDNAIHESETSDDKTFS